MFGKGKSTLGVLYVCSERNAEFSWGLHAVFDALSAKTPLREALASA